MRPLRDWSESNLEAALASPVGEELWAEAYLELWERSYDFADEYAKSVGDAWFVDSTYSVQ